MSIQTLWVPFEALNSTTHSASTRLVWLLLARRPPGNLLPESRLRKLSGLDAKTVAAALARLAREPLAPCSAKPHRSSAAIPWALLSSAGISPRGRLLYGQLQAVPKFARQGGCFTYAALSRLTVSSADVLRQAVAELAAAGWLAISQANRKSPLSFTLRNPVSTQVRARISSTRRRLRSARYLGEAVLREFLRLLIDIDQYEENAAPDFLLNPFTGELMELDRYYPTAGFAVEFNGDQHYELTNLATFEETVKQVGRDAMKAFICRERGIELAIIHPEDLNLKAINQKIPRHVPRRDLEGMDPLVAALEGMASEYRERAAEERARQVPHPSGGQLGARA